MNTNRGERLRAGRRLLAGMLTPPALAAVGVLVLSGTGATFHGVSAWWQLLLLLAGLSLTGLALAVRPRERFMAQANLLERGSPGGRRVADFAAVATTLGLTFLFLAPEWRTDAPPRRAQVLVFRQESFTGSDAGPRLTVVGDLAGGVTVGPNWIVDSSPDSTTSVWRPVAVIPKGESVWVKVGESRWPLSIPAPGVPVSAASSAFAARWAGRVAGLRAAQPGEPVYPLEWLTPLEAPPPQFPPAEEALGGGAEARWRRGGVPRRRVTPAIPVGDVAGPQVRAGAGAAGVGAFGGCLWHGVPHLGTTGNLARLARQPHAAGSVARRGLRRERGGSVPDTGKLPRPERR
jgi:hypothetical protein